MKRVVLSGFGAAFLVTCVALIAANSASTTALCKDEPKEGLCKTVSKEFVAESGESKLETPVGLITCGTSKFNAFSNEGSTGKGLPLKVNMSSSFSGCTREGKECTVTTLKNITLYKWTSGSDGEIEFINNGSTPPLLTVTCSKVVECTYTFETPFEFQGGGKATIIANKEVLGKATGALCPGSGAAIEFSMTGVTSEARFLANASPKVEICKQSETPCSTENRYAAPVSFAAALDIGTRSMLRPKITEESEETEYAISCESSALEGKVTLEAWPMAGEISALSFSECGGTCAVKALKTPFSVQLEATGGGNGTITLTGSPRIRARCIGAYKCTYESASFSVTGGTPAKVSPSALTKLVAAESDAKCGAEMKWQATYTFSKPETAGEAKMWIVRDGV